MWLYNQLRFSLRSDSLDRQDSECFHMTQFSRALKSLITRREFIRSFVTHRLVNYSNSTKRRGHCCHVVTAVTWSLLPRGQCGHAVSAATRSHSRASTRSLSDAARRSPSQPITQLHSHAVTWPRNNAVVLLRGHRVARPPSHAIA